MTCINCNKKVTVRFCSHCGQCGDVKRITLKEGWYDFWARIYGFDGMFPRTLRDLTLCPGIASREFIKGNRVKYYGPAGYFFLMITLYLLTISLLGIDLREFLSESQKAVNIFQPGDGQEMINEMAEFVSTKFKWVAFFYVPLDAFVARYLFFRKSGYNFLENAVLPFFVRWHMYWLSIISVIIYKFTGTSFLNSLSPIILIFYLGYSYSNLIDYQPKWKSALKGMGIFFCSMIILLIIVSIVVATIVLLTNSE